jgi:hypothetical protein
MYIYDRLSRVYQLNRSGLEEAPKNRDDFLKDVRDKPANFLPRSSLASLAGPDAFLCTPRGTTRLHSVVVNGVTETRRLAGERLPIASPACAATVLCPPTFQPPHATGDATHFVSLDRNIIRVVELAGLFGVNLSGVIGTRAERAAHKAAVAVKSLPSTAPLGGLSFVAIRQGSGARLRREVHIHRIPAEANGARIVQALVDGDRVAPICHRTGLLFCNLGNVEHVHMAWGQADTERCGRHRTGGLRCRMEKHLGTCPQEPRRSFATRLPTGPQVSRSGCFLLWSREGLAAPP